MDLDEPLLRPRNQLVEEGAAMGVVGSLVRTPLPFGRWVRLQILDGQVGHQGLDRHRFPLDDEGYLGWRWTADRVSCKDPVDEGALRYVVRLGDRTPLPLLACVALKVVEAFGGSQSGGYLRYPGNDERVTGGMNPRALTGIVGQRLCAPGSDLFGMQLGMSQRRVPKQQSGLQFDPSYRHVTGDNVVVSRGWRYILPMDEATG